MSDEARVIARGLGKRFSGGEIALDALSFQIEPAQVTGLVGPDGAGKTTLLRIIAGLLEPTEGTVFACGLDVRREPDRLRSELSYMPQRFGLYEDLTVAENLEFHAELRGVPWSEKRATFERLLAFTGLAAFTRRLAGKLSGGMKQKLGLACALIRTPKLLLLDEPSVGVDPISRRELWRLVYELVAEGISVVWSTSYLDEAERCRSVIALDRGRLVFAGPPEELTAKATGRTFLLRGAERKRAALAAAMRRDEVVDGSIQGGSVRLVLAQGVDPPSPAGFGSGEVMVVPTAPRFEDAFIDLLGGAPKGDSPLAGPARASIGASGSAVVIADGLTKRFGTFTAARDISFRIGRGEIFGLLGPNGAGKSTTFKMLCGLLRPTAGRALVAGYDLYRAGGAARARLGYMAQKFSLYGDLSTEQNLTFFSGVYGLKGARRRDAIERMTHVFDLAPYLGANAGSLPLGFKQRLALACAIMHDPPILFLDEPTSGVDPITRREFWSHINAMVERGVTVLVTTHFMDEAEYCDRIALIYKGSMIADGSPDELKRTRERKSDAEPTLEEAFIRIIEAFDAEGDAA